MKLNVVLFQPEIPQNTGNIMRTCVGTNTRLHLIKPLGFKLDEARLRRSCVDYYDYIDYVVYENFEDFLLKNPNAKIFYLTRYGKKPLSSFDFTCIVDDIYLMFGKESTGIPYDILANNLEHCFRFPTTDKIRSLNLSNCVAIAIYEVLRQLNYENLGLSMTEPDKFKGKDFLEQFKK